MVVPDSNYIAEIILFGEGFSDTRLLATKVYTLYQLCAQQLSKQGPTVRFFEAFFSEVFFVQIFTISVFVRWPPCCVTPVERNAIRRI